jgi:hypothetical protein
MTTISFPVCGALESLERLIDHDEGMNIGAVHDAFSGYAE